MSLDIIDNKLNHDNLVTKFTILFLSETAVNTLDMSEFDESVFDTVVASQVSVEAGRLAVISLQLSPNFHVLTS